jgi:hypothetical protein
MSKEETEALRVQVADLEVDIRRLKKIISRAADALDDYPYGQLELIAELRKAAE